MKRLYVVNNGQAYSSNHTYLVEADADDWDDLQHTMLLCCGRDKDEKASVEAVAFQWESENTCEPAWLVDAERFFRHTDEVTPYYFDVDRAPRGESKITRDHYALDTRGVSVRDMRSLLDGWKRCEAENKYFHAEPFASLLALAVERGEFPEAVK